MTDNFDKIASILKFDSEDDFDGLDFKEEIDKLYNK
jgi:hypothetical protein